MVKLYFDVFGQGQKAEKAERPAAAGNGPFSPGNLCSI